MKKDANKSPSPAKLRRHTEKALLASEERYRRLFEKSHDAIMTLEPPSWKFTTGNPAAIAMFKAKNEAEFVSCEPWKLSPERQPDGRLSDEKSQAMIAKAMREGSNFFEWIHKRLNGEEFPATVLLSRVEQDKFSFLQATVRDITGQKRAEEALLESKALVEAVVENIPLMIFLKEATDLRFVIFNRAGEELLGYDRKTLLGKNDLDLFPPEQAAHFVAKDREVLDGKAALLDIPEEPILTAKKGRRLLHTRKVCIRGADGTTKYLLGISEDITERKQAEAEIRKLNETLEQRVHERTTELARANQELETLIRIASHDLRSPLVNIQGFCQLLNKACASITSLLADVSLPDEARQTLAASREKAEKSIRFINAGVEKMNSLIGGLLRLSRLGRAPLVLQSLDMNVLLNTVVEAMTFQIRAAAADVTVETLPDCRADAALINQVFSNLLDNAVKYRDPARRLRARIWGRHPGWGRRPGWDCREKDAHTVYCVEDNGLGVAPEHQQKIWDLFYRPNHQENGAGEGVGLTVVQQIVERHGGKVWVESE
ncbi:MAG: PAS domain S-box protein, partial [Kiritimatiellia bacterium]